MGENRLFQNQIKPNWCPGCGDFAVLNALQHSLASCGLEPHQVGIVSGIGCSGRISGYLYAYGFHAAHGRALPVAQGLKMANPSLTVVACGGDGDGFAIGTGHTVHGIRRNMDMTYIVMDNHVYGLTKGQVSPRSDRGFLSKTTPEGSIEPPVSALELAMAAGAGFVAQGFSQDLPGLTRMIEAGIRHKGFSFINVLSPCVTFNRVNTYEWFQKRLVNLSEKPEYDQENRQMAMETVMKYDGLVNGIVYRNTQRLEYQAELPGSYPERPGMNGKLAADVFQKLMEEFR